MKYSKYLIPTLSVCLFLSFTACTEDKELTQATIIQGKVYDSNKQQPVVNTTVYIQTYEIGTTPSNLGQTIYKSILDSVKTDATGNYAITLQGGKYNRSLKMQVRLNNAKFKYTYEQKWHIFNGEENKIDFNIIELHPLRLRLIVKNNPRPPLMVQIPVANEKKATIYGINADTTVSLAVIPNGVNGIDYFIVHPIHNNKIMSRYDTINAKGFKPYYQRTLTLEPEKFFDNSK